MWFAPTGHTLRGAFLDYWNRYGGLAQFGYPLTEEFFEPVGADNKLYQVQYFERNRFEYHPENKGTQYEVLLGVLGLDFRKADAPVPSLPPSSQPFYYFSETGHNLSGKFKEYWDTHGGLFVHGFPITEPVMERSTNGKEYLVQWFERNRFELHPENAGSPYEVLLGVLGRQLSEKKGYPYGWYPPYGHASNFSWVAGRYYDDTRFCVPCGCDNIRFVPNTKPGIDLSRGTSVAPVGSVWQTAKFGRNGEPGTLRHLNLVVAFGYLQKPDGLNTEPEMSETCEKPSYVVDGVFPNPVQ